MLLINQIIKLSLIALCISLCQTASFGQQTWERIYGGLQSEAANAVQQTSDGGYIVGGYTSSYGAGAADMYLLKLDSNGDTSWTKTYGYTIGETINSLQQTSDGGYILAGTQTTFGVISSQIYLVKTDSDGDTLWTKQFYNWSDVVPNSIDQTSDGGYIIGAHVVDFGDSSTIAKTDVNGDVLWTKRYAKTTIDGIEQTADGGYIVTGMTPIDTIPSRLKPYILKMDMNGDSLWQHSYFEPNYYVYEARVVKELSDGSYVYVMSYYPGDDPGLKHVSRLIKVNANGQLVWFRQLGGGVIGHYVNSIDETLDGGLICGGVLDKFFATMGSPLIQHNNFFLTRLDSLGNSLWLNEYGEISDYSNEGCASVKATTSGGFIAGGYRGDDMYVVLTDSLGNYRDGSIEGNVYQDVDLSCSQTLGDVNLGGIIVEATLNGPSSFTYYATTDSSGHYSIPCQIGNYTVSIPNLHPYYNLNCPQNTGVITAHSYDTIDFPLEVLALCPVMNVDVSAPLLRQIVPSVYSIQYCNIGTDTAQNVEITLEIDSFLNILNFSQAPTSQVGNSYTFNVGTVGIGDCDNIYLTVQVDTSAILGQTHCLEVSITPDSLCFPTNWTGMLLDVNGTCQNDSIYFNIQNQTTTGLATPRSYWVFEDNIIMRTGTVTVPSGGASTVVVPAQPRKFYRIEVAQESGIPWTVSDSIVSAFVEGCVPDVHGEFNIGFPTQFPNGHAPTFRAIDCQQNRGSYDPNNKEAQPMGYNTEHYIDQNQYIDYKINFQNTGTDTAFFVTLIDTLSPYLDPASVQLTSASHPYTWKIKNNGVLEVKFDYIMLPDSNVNEPASHGFAKFRIQQQANNPVGTIINNFADIYFDLNLPVRTNTSYHEIGINFYILSIVPLESAPDVQVNAFPNPFTHSTTIEVEGTTYDNLTLCVYDLMGRQVSLLSEENTNTIELSRNNLETGVYVFKLLGNGEPISSGKIIAQ